MKLNIPAEGLPSFTDANNVTTGQGRMEHRIFKRDQSWCYEAIWALCGRKLRAMVTRNAYDNQSFCKVQSFHEDTMEWKFLCDIPFGKGLACYKVSWATDITPDTSFFEADADLVLEKACRILNPFYAQVAEAAEKSSETRAQAAYITKIELIARVSFSDGTSVDRPVDRT